MEAIYILRQRVQCKHKRITKTQEIMSLLEVINKAQVMDVKEWKSMT
jgi:hypothetical protein